jgi:hypothetical protein
VGNAIEKEISLLREMSDAVHQGAASPR